MYMMYARGERDVSRASMDTASFGVERRERVARWEAVRAAGGVRATPTHLVHHAHGTRRHLSLSGLLSQSG